MAAREALGVSEARLGCEVALLRPRSGFCLGGRLIVLHPCVVCVEHGGCTYIYGGA